MKKSLRQGKKKRTPTLFESFEEEKDEDVVHIKMASKHSERSNGSEGGSQHLKELEKCLEAIVNQGKLQEAGRD